MQHQQMPLMRLVPPISPTADQDTAERAVMRDVAAFTRDRLAALPLHSDVRRELAYVATRLDLAARSLPPQEATGRQEMG